MGLIATGKRQNLVASIFWILTILVSMGIGQCLGQVFSPPEEGQFEIIKVQTAISFSQNTTFNLSYSSSKSRLPNALITYTTFESKHYVGATPPIILAWFNIRAINVTQTYIVVYDENNNASSSALEFHMFDVMVSSVDDKYFQIVNWEYSGPRMVSGVTNFFNVTLPVTPQPWNYCFNSPTSTVRQNIFFMLTFNGFRGESWLSMSRDVTFHPSRFTFHIYNSSRTPFNIALYSDHLSWVDKYYLGFLFICPSSYLLRQKYAAEVHLIIVGSQLVCQPYPMFNQTFLTLQNDYNYAQFIGTRFFIPNVNSSSPFSFQYDFSLNPNINSSRRYFQAWKMCGRAEYTVLFIAQKYCSGNRTFVIENNASSCQCDQSLNWFQTGAVQCDYRCPQPLVAVNFACYSCYSVYGPGCLTCNNLSCLTCMTNFVLENGTCACNNSYYLTATQDCQQCSNTYGPYCAACTSSKCLLCLNSLNLSTNQQYCMCNQSSFLANNLSCIQCALAYGSACIQCTSSQCVRCANNYMLINFNCACSGPDRFEFLGICFLCNQTFGVGCSTCTQFACTSCRPNYKHIANGQCVCEAPNVLDSLGGVCICTTCQNPNAPLTPIYEPIQKISQTLTISSQFVQIGSSIYVQLFFNYPLNQLTQLIPLKSNILAKLSDDSPVRGINWLGNSVMFQILLQSYNSGQNLSILIPNPMYILWNQIPLSNQLQLIPIQPYITQNDSTGIEILARLGSILQWVYPLSILFSWGSLNMGFQMWFLLSYYLYLKPHMYGHIQTALQTLNSIKLAQIVPSDMLPHLGIRHSQVNFIQKVLQKNKQFSYYTIQLFAIYIIAIIICLSIRRYIKSKAQYKKYAIYENFIKHYKEYIVANFFSLFPFLALYIAIQFESCFKTGWQFEQQAYFANLMITATVLMIAVMLAILVLCLYPFRSQFLQENYAIIYNKAHPSCIFVYVEYFLRTFKPLVFVAVIFICRQFDPVLGQVILVGFTLTYLLVVTINFKKYTNKLYWVLGVVKIIMFIGFQIGYLFLPTAQSQGSPIDSEQAESSDMVCFYLIILLVGYDFAQFFIKLVQLIISNKYGWLEVYKSHQIAPTQTQINVKFGKEDNKNPHQA